MTLQHTIRNIKSVANNIENKLINFTDKENMKKRFGIGYPVEKDEYLHTLMIHNVVSEPSCIIKNFTEKVIKEGLKQCKDNYTKEKIKTVYVKIPGTNDTNEVLDLDCVSEIEW